MSAQIVTALERLFDRYRIVFWYDEKKELRSTFESLALDKVEKLEIQDNEFGLKHRILRESPKQQFLIYKEDKQPEPLQNWLLDVELANTTFRTDQVAIWLSELELPNEFISIVEQHTGFFEGPKAAAEKRKQALKKMLSQEDIQSQVRLKMLAACVGASQAADARIDIILEALLSELTKDKQPLLKLIEACGLTEFLWDRVSKAYDYVTDQPSVKDFAIELFKSCYYMGVDESPSGGNIRLSNNALVFFKRWKDSRTHQSVFHVLSDQFAELLEIEVDLHDRQLKEVIELDYFQLVDRKIIYELVQAVDQRTISEGEISLYCRNRRQSYWYAEFQHLYEAVDIAGQFFAALDAIQLNMSDHTTAVQNYVEHWYRVDQLYRQFIYRFKAAAQQTLLKSLSDKIENLYTNRYLLPLNNNWQAHVDAMPRWGVPGVAQQTEFYPTWVKPFYDKKIKVCVIISDALRYEAGHELVSLIRQENRYQADIRHALSALPSYTQLGMASLLPQGEAKRSIAENKTATVNLGKQSTAGTDNRDKYLKSVLGDRAGALTAKTVMENTSTQNREIFTADCVMYVYHNRIDHTGDKMQSEGEAFEAVDRSFDDLIKLVKKVTSANVNNIVITADHGFIYQNRPLDESDFIPNDVAGEVLYNDRRFVLGKQLQCNNALKSFGAQELGLEGDVHAVIPKGIQRLRLSGSGSRFVHGGASLQEVIIPVISVNKKKTADVSKVEVEILRGGTDKITAGQLAVTLYQAEPVTDKVQARQLRVGLYTEEGILISDQHDVLLDLTSDSAREREFKLRFVLTQEADSVNNQQVFLKLEEPEDGSNQYRRYKELSYTIQRRFTTDFDF